eukprot:CAMPEP_0170527830 /NCGR_PEP_ID=MMETSP0209-20121228/13311_1 /TAXON_ID=665100 ORGANISM="Litonotus pictus, Strain P1" /NCGR_SAMPLE_ID=MMETSP0209 /ASSEMBLY_ACC=CAM_ASM_000301 /LENGTH=478 /DNA_ID=CAMNT_0010818635 /DNA_START=18 /DNA_END=1454 /DNA_ORIENTATION=+
MTKDKEFYSKILGHLHPIIQHSKKLQVPTTMGMFLKTPEYYRETKANTFKIRILKSRIIMTKDKEFYSRILGAQQGDFEKSNTIKAVMGYFFPYAVIVVRGEQWQRIRKIMSKAINNTSFELVIPYLIRNVSYSLENNSEGLCLANEHSSYDLISRIIFDGFHCLVYDWDPETLKFNPESSKLLDSCNIIGEAIGERFILPYPILWKIPTKKNKKYDEACKVIRDFIEKFLKEQRSIFIRNKEEILQKKHKSLLQEMLLANESEDSSKRITYEEMIDQVAILFFGGYDTTSNVILFCLNYLARNPDIQSKLREVLIKEFPNGEEDVLQAGINGIEKISYLSHFVNETHRICPLTIITRDCVRDTEVQGYQIKKGETVMIDNIGIGKREDFWNSMTDLEVFRPERWAEHKPSPLETNIPFGFGGRICPGKRIASYEIKAFLAVALLKHKIVLRNPEEKFEITAKLGFNLQGGDVNFIRI